MASSARKTNRAGPGAAAGACLAAAAAAVAFAGWKAAGLPFPPFDLFDELVRVVPGAAVTAWIDGAVIVLQAAGVSSVATAAKHGEQLIAVVTFLALGAGAGAAMFAALAISDEPAALFGGVLGAAVGLIVVVVERSLGRVAPGVHVETVWLFALFLAWGLVLGAAHDAWRARGETHDAPAGARRRFLISLAWMTTAPSIVVAVCASALGRGRGALGVRWSDTHALPNAGASVRPLPGTRAEFTPLEDHYRVDINTRPPRIAAASWRLKITGLVDHPIDLSLDDVRREAPVVQFITLSCISNPLGGDLIGTQRWTGASLARVLERASPQPAATHAKVKSADGFFELVALSAVHRDPRVMLAYAWDDVPIAMEHGFPLRMFIPDVYGMKQPKWIEEIELVRAWEPGYWVLRGWDREGRMAATSVIDAARYDAQRGIVSAGGIAHAGVRGISRVEVTADGNSWTEASLRDPLSSATWVVWRADIPSARGSERVSVRCIDGQGVVQREPFHTVRVKS